jgi:phosphatidylglycerol:prolipoprotein diacylglycerol transferase
MLTLFQNLFSPPRHLILLIITAWIGLALAEKRVERHAFTKDKLSNLVSSLIAAFILGGRISFVLQNLPTFIKSPISMVSINADLFDLIGASATAFIAIVIYIQRNRVSPWKTLDALTPFFAILSIGLGLTHLAAGTAFGKETDLFWGINLWNAKRHPTQIYEIIASSLIFIQLWFYQQSSRPGILFLTFAGLTAGSQLFIQGFRGDSTFINNGIREGQAAAWAALIVIFVLLEKRLKVPKK